jgi:hypothetical protein
LRDLAPLPAVRFAAWLGHTGALLRGARSTPRSSRSRGSAVKSDLVV